MQIESGDFWQMETKSGRLEPESGRFEPELGQLEPELGQLEQESPCFRTESESNRVELEETENDIDLGNLVNYLDMIEEVSLNCEIEPVEDMNVTPGNIDISDLELSIGAMSIPEDDCDEILNYKLVQELTEAEVIGPILLGMKKPVHVLQIGSSVREILNMITVAVVDVQTRK